MVLLANPVISFALFIYLNIDNVMSGGPIIVEGGEHYGIFSSDGSVMGIISLISEANWYFLDCSGWVLVPCEASTVLFPGFGGGVA